LNVGIIGLGAVGTAVLEGMQLHHEVHGYDTDGRGEWKQIFETDAVFICVPTNGLRNGKLETEIVEEVVSRLSDDKFEGIVIVKSTLQPGTMDCLHSLYHTIRLVYMPEFLREKDAVEWFQNPDRLVAAGRPEDVEAALSFFKWIPESVPRLVMTFLEAEIGKLAHNAYIATKVTFTCEVERLCRTFNADPEPVMEIVWRDRRVQNPAHLTPGLGGFDGKCVPKDTRALQSLDVDTPLLDAVCKTGSLSTVSRKMENTSLKSINPTYRQKLRKNIRVILAKLFLGSFVILMSWMIIDITTTSLTENNPAIHIISTESDWFDIEVDDYITILNINSTVLDSESSSHTFCYPADFGDGQDCDTTVTHHLTLVVNSTNTSYELSSIGFLEECFGRECAATGKVVSIRGDVRWLTVVDYYVV
jgi:UDPglucose 6-dehydrogenase